MWRWAEDHVDIALARRIQAHVRAELVAFKVPRYVQSWRSLPAHTVRADLKNKISDQDSRQRLRDRPGPEGVPNLTAAACRRTEPASTWQT